MKTAYSMLLVGLLGLTALVAGCEGSGNDPKPHMLGTGNPAIKIKSVPDMGQMGSVTGVVTGVMSDVVTGGYVVAMYIHVPYEGWWIKPYFESVIPIDDEGNWDARMTTGGVDELADQVVVYLVPHAAEADIPSLLGDENLPASLAGYPRDNARR